MDRVYKPWGYYEDLYRSAEVTLKKLMIKSGEEISYQLHQERAEMWYIVSGEGKFVKNGVNRLVFPGDIVTVEVGAKHQIVNVGDKPVIIHEMQCGNCREDDIERIEDKYGR